MYLTLPRHEILAETGRAVPYVEKGFYDLCVWRDDDNSISPLLKRVGVQVAFSSLFFLSLIEGIARTAFAFLTVPFSENWHKWFQGSYCAIITSFFSLYGLCINLFVQKVSPAIVTFDLTFRSPLANEFLYQACETGNYQLARTLLKQKVDPHEIHNTVGVSAALAPYLCGQPHLEELFELTPYENDYLRLKQLSHWLGLTGTIKLHDRELTLEGAPSRWMFRSLAESLEKFFGSRNFFGVTLREEALSHLREALIDAYENHSYEKISQRVRDRSLTFIGAGWKHHGICLAFASPSDGSDDYYMAIGNRGEGANHSTTLDVFKITPSLFTPEIVEEIFSKETTEADVAITYFYKVLPAKLSETGKIETDSLCEAFKEIAPKPSKEGVCALASKKAALRFAWALSLDHPTTEAGLRATLQQARLEVKLFSDWSSTHYLDDNKPAENFPFFPSLEPRETIIGQALLRGVKKMERFRRLNGSLAPPGLFNWLFR